jgi:hypothetical protein
MRTTYLEALHYENVDTSKYYLYGTPPERSTIP